MFYFWCFNNDSCLFDFLLKSLITFLVFIDFSKKIFYSFLLDSGQQYLIRIPGMIEMIFFFNQVQLTQNELFSLV